MIIFQKSFIIAFFSSLIFFSITYIYLIIFKHCLLNLNLILYMTVGWFIICCIYLMYKFRKNKGFLLIYKIIGSILLIFFLTSIFLFKIEDIFFWSSMRDNYNDYFKFNNLLLGINNLLGFIYIIVGILEINFIFNKQKYPD